MKFIVNTKMDDIQGGPIRHKEFRISKILGQKQYFLPFMILLIYFVDFLVLSEELFFSNDAKAYFFKIYMWKNYFEWY